MDSKAEGAVMKALRKGQDVPLVSCRGEKVTAHRTARNAVTGEIMVLYSKEGDNNSLWLARDEDSFFGYAVDTDKGSPTHGQIIPYYSIDASRLKRHEA